LGLTKANQTKAIKLASLKLGSKVGFYTLTFRGFFFA